MIDEEKFFQYCNDVNEVVWERRISKQDVEDWIKNFKPQKNINVRQLAMDLLLGFIYYNESEIKYLCKHAFSEYKRQMIKEKILTGISIKDAEKSFNDSINKIQFIGKNGDSSAHFAYLFRQIHDLPLDIFINSIDEIKPDAQTLIFVDDFIGTGDTVLKFNQSLKNAGIFTKFPKIQIYYLSLIVTELGLKKIQSSDANCKLIYAEMIPQEYKVFSPDTKILSGYSASDMKIAQITCQKIGIFLEGDMYALGYKNSELLIGLHHNIPNNTLPVIWSSNKDWVPIFPRRRKKYWS